MRGHHHLESEEDAPPSEEVGRAIGRIASGLFVVTACYEGTRDGMLGSWINQAAFDPPAITVAVKKNRSLRLLIESAGALVVNVLGKEDGELMKPFFKPPEPGTDPFARLETEPCPAAGEAPVLRGALAWLGCLVRDGFDAGDHVIYLAEVVDGRVLKKGDPKVHFRDTGFKY